MPGSIVIKNLKHIHELTFEMPGRGVHVLTGGNGAGKTSLLACLRRIGQPHAFAYHFAASVHSKALDNFENARISYTVGLQTVTYAYGGERWVPRPRSLNRLIDNFGYPSVYYVGATADRITPRPEDFKPQRVAQVAKEIRDTANKIFDTKKFDNLRTINLKRGSGNSAFLMQSMPPPGAKYYSERNFSLGELCILKLIRDLMNCAVGSLVLIDELELALHPKAQILLLEYLTEMSIKKQLTIIFSTHSVSLLKQVPHQNILFLENVNGIVRAVKGCFPTYALGNIAFDEERAPDRVLYVEDLAATHLVEALVKLCINLKYRSEAVQYPTVLVAPIGPFISVVRFLPRSRSLLPNSTKSYAVLDGDVRTETLAEWRQTQQHAILAEFQSHQNIRYLPWTPEVGLVEYMIDNTVDAQARLRLHFQDQRINIPANLLRLDQALIGKAKRDACKTLTTSITEHVKGYLPNVDHATTSKALFASFATWYFETRQADAMGLVGPWI